MNDHNGGKSLFSFSDLVLLAKGVIVLCAFLAFAISMRQKEFDRFSEIKSLFERRTL